MSGEDLAGYSRVLSLLVQEEVERLMDLGVRHIGYGLKRHGVCIELQATDVPAENIGLVRDIFRQIVQSTLQKPLP